MKLRNLFLFANLLLAISEVNGASIFSFERANSLQKEEIRKVPYLSCPVLKERINDFLHYHYVFKDFDENISKRTFQMFFKLLDPGKLYFTQKDIDSFKPMEASLGKSIQNVDCRFAGDIYSIYKQRIFTANEFISQILESKFEFSTNEFLETDRKKVSWAKNNDELKERWRKSLKFIVLNMKESKDINSITDRLKKRYKNIYKDILDRSTDDVHAIFLNAFAMSLDPHSSFLTPNDNAQFQIDFSLKLVGIGATLINPDGYTTIDAIVPGGAAAKDGRLKKGDKIIAVDSGDGNGMQDVIDLELEKVVQMIRGKEGSTVKLLIMRKAPHGEVQRFQLDLTRAVVQIKDSEARSDILTIDGKKIGIINLPSFYIDYRDCQENPFNCRSSANDMAREIRKLKAQKINGIVIDLRRNGGGDLSEVQRIVGLFIDNPVVTQIQDREAQVRSLEASAKAFYTGPLGILVSKYTASASEILAGAVQDYGRGLILGDSRTFGKGTVQTVMEIPGTGGRQSNGAIHVTIAKFFRPSGKSNQEKGILSDIIIPDLLDATETGEKESEYALPYTTIPPAKEFAKTSSLDTLIAKLKIISQERVSKSPDFKEIIANMKKAKQDKNTLVSLKEDNQKKSLNKNKPNKKGPSSNTGNDDDLPDFSIKVIGENDFMLKESAHIIADSENILKDSGNASQRQR